jgi:beta-galactosidase
MGILVLDETAVWASDGGPKLDDPLFWKDTERHLAALILRDRNHPSVFGWSVSNEVMPIVRGVMRNPPGMMDELIRHYSIWADICRRIDPTRPWISADGEDDGQGALPIYMVHYGGPSAMQRAAASGKPWGVGEAGDAYYGTPVQVAETNGERAYESFEGRMEGVAISSYQSLIEQRENQAIYRSVFNLVWYGLQPLPLGMKDPSSPPKLSDGIFFPAPVEGKPGVQPQRLGPYSTTLNPGYDAALPLYKTWPLFEAIQNAAAEPPVTGKWSKQPSPVPREAAPPIPAIASARVLAGGHSSLAVDLQNVGVPRDLLASSAAPQVVFVDGVNPPEGEIHRVLTDTLQRGGTVFVWGADSNALPLLNRWLPSPLEVTMRTASSLLPVTPDPVISGVTPSSLYFCDQQPPEITSVGLAGPFIASSRVLLKACDTNWLLWNNQPEYAKTAMVLRSERETKPSGVVFAEKSIGPGRILLTTLPTQPRSLRAEKINRTILANLGFPLKTGMDSGKPLLRTGVLVRALVCGYFPASEVPQASWQDNGFRAQDMIEGRKWKSVFQESGIFDLSQMNLSGSAQNAEAYLSFWVYSPRSLEDLLLEPDLPRIDLHVTQRDAAEIWLNQTKILDKPGDQSTGAAEALRLHAGWNHFFVRTAHRSGKWEFAAHFTASQPDFLSQLDSALEMP